MAHLYGFGVLKPSFSWPALEPSADTRAAHGERPHVLHGGGKRRRVARTVGHSQRAERRVLMCEELLTTQLVTTLDEVTVPKGTKLLLRTPQAGG